MKNADKTNMNELVQLVAEKTGLSRNVADGFLKKLFAVIEDGLRADGAVKINNFGTFRLQWNEPRKSVDVNTGEEILIEGYNKVVFLPENFLKEKVNEPFAYLETVVLDGDKLPEQQKTEDIPLQKLDMQAEEIKDILADIQELDAGREPEVEVPASEHVPEAVDKTTPRRKREVVLRFQTAERQHIPETVDRSAEEHLEEHAEGKGGNGVADEDENGGTQIERRAPAYRFGDAQRDAHQIGEEKAGNAEPERDGNALPDEVPRRFVGVLVRMRLESATVPDQPVAVAGENRFVEAVVRIELLPVLLGEIDRTVGGLCRGGAAAREPAHRQQALLHRAAGHELSQQKTNQRNPEKRRDHQQ